jgi:hypothetical protein
MLHRTVAPFVIKIYNHGIYSRVLKIKYGEFYRKNAAYSANSHDEQIFSFWSSFPLFAEFFYLSAVLEFSICSFLAFQASQMDD